MNQAEALIEWQLPFFNEFRHIRRLRACTFSENAEPSSTSYMTQEITKLLIDNASWGDYSLSFRRLQLLLNHISP